MIAVVCFFLYYLFSLSPVPLTRIYWGIEIVCHVKLFIKSVSGHYSVDFIILCECFNLNHYLGCPPYSILEHLTSRSSLLF